MLQTVPALNYGGNAPANVVIPAPIAYIKVVAVKKLVVGFLRGAIGHPFGIVSGVLWASSWGTFLHLTVWCGI